MLNSEAMNTKDIAQISVVAALLIYDPLMVIRVLASCALLGCGLVLLQRGLTALTLIGGKRKLPN